MGNLTDRCKCDICGKMVGRNLGLKAHKKFVHSDRNFKECDICGYQTDNVEKHIANNHGEAKVCTICNLNVMNLTSHMSRFHTKRSRERVKCDICDDVVFKANLNRHKISKHHDSKVNCDTCGKLLSCSSVYMHQKRYHSNEQWHCDQCDETFAVKSNLILHKKSKHC